MGLEQISAAEWSASAVLAVTLSWICVTDLRSFRIPDAASLGLVALGLAFSLATPLVTFEQALLGAAVGYGVFATLGAVFFWRTGRDGLGLGDAKLLAGAGAWLGLIHLPLVVLGAAVSALVFAVVTRQRRIAFGPWLAGAFWIVWVSRISAA